ncbi:MAG TPA: carbon storage regulator CsrA [Candidatus Pseudogracilibacillus intestinigallinarum]|uniref:Translational regulator CsrA n=1 Tax=Candidatus Pseudogracilibacillus intestinigallinarum TaxID=2838742 RepID=A0A9D1PJT9_9BACI|nr:carbon storage regulator CsrA [Candidatus Pseudogracilibacillus intestinigallinarum]
MLVLSRKKQQSIRIGNDIELTVIAIEGDQVKLGIKAPKNIEIHRGEVFEAIQTANNEAVHVSIDVMKLMKKNPL